MGDVRLDSVFRCSTLSSAMSRPTESIDRQNNIYLCITTAMGFSRPPELAAGCQARCQWGAGIDAGPANWFFRM